MKCSWEYVNLQRAFEDMHYFRGNGKLWEKFKSSRAVTVTSPALMLDATLYQDSTQSRGGASQVFTRTEGYHPGGTVIYTLYR